MCNRRRCDNSRKASRIYRSNEKENTWTLLTHCIIYRQHLVARNFSAELHNSLHIVIKWINKIKAHSLNDRLFRALYLDKEEDFERLLLHTAVRLLLKGACMTRFYSLHSLVIQFLSGINCQLAEVVKSLKNDVAYLTDVFTFINEVNKKTLGLNDHAYQVQKRDNVIYIEALLVQKKYGAKHSVSISKSLRQ